MTCGTFDQWSSVVLYISSSVEGKKKSHFYSPQGNEHGEFWTSGYSNSSGVSCTNQGCDSLSDYMMEGQDQPITWTDGPFATVVFTSGYRCTKVHPYLRTLYAVSCSLHPQLLMCEVNCRKGIILSKNCKRNGGGVASWQGWYLMELLSFL